VGAAADHQHLRFHPRHPGQGLLHRLLAARFLDVAGFRIHHPGGIAQPPAADLPGQNDDSDLKLANGLHVPPWSIPDHINYDGRPVYYPGTYSSGHDQGSGACGRVPPIDDHYEAVHIAHAYWTTTRDREVFEKKIRGLTVFERLTKAFDCPVIDRTTGLAETTEADRAVGFGFCDGESHTGRLLFASLLRYRAAGEMAGLARALGYPERIGDYQQAQRLIRANLVPTFADPKAIGGWLRASTA